MSPSASPARAGSPARTEQTEIERKYDVDESAAVPDLVGVTAGAVTVARVVRDEPVTLAATYWDSAEHVLLAARTTLRRREGGGDEGWHLKLPPLATSSGRREVHWPLGAADEPVPDALRRLVEARLRGRAVHPVLRLETIRTVTRLRRADGSDLAEVADDLVTAVDPDTASRRSWREWEVELAPGVDGVRGERLLDAVEARLEQAGAEPSASKSKLARGLGGDPTTTVRGGAAATASRGVAPKKKSAAAFVQSAVAGLRDDLIALDADVRDDAPDAVHRLRTTIRRLRTVLTIWHGVLDGELAATVVSGAAHVGSVAGPARDVEVARARVPGGASEAPTGLVPVQTTGRLSAHLGERLRETSGDVRRLLDGRPWFDLLDALDVLVEAPPTGAHAADDAASLAERRLGRERRRARRRAKAAVRVVDRGVGGGDDAADAGRSLGDDEVDVLHDARKAARRYRYALESWSVRSGSGRGTARRAATVQDALGDHRDACAAVVVDREVATAAHRAGEDTFGYGVLVMVETARAERALERFRVAAASL